MPTLVTGIGCYEEHGDCSELKREIHVEKHGLKYVAYAFKNMDFVPINKGRLSYKRLLKDIIKYKEQYKSFYNGFESKIVRFKRS